MAFPLLSSPSLVSICDKSFITPSSLTPPTLRLHKLSFIEQSFSNMYIPLAFFYPKVEQREESKSSHELSHIAHLLQTSLSQTLASYYPYAGKLRDNTTVDCNDMGAEFLSVRIKCHMSEILDHPHAESIVFPKNLPWANNYEGGNLLVAQLSKFDCGGIAVSVCLSHKIGDGCSVLNFLNDWSSLTRDHTKTTLVPSPRFVGDSVFSTQKYGPLTTPQIVSDLSECVQKRFIFPTAKLDALRAKVAAESGVENPTRSEIVSALLFKCATKAASSTILRPSKLVHYLNVRTMIKPRLPRSAIGDLLSVFSTTVTNEKDIELPILVCNMRKEVVRAYKKDQVEQNELVLEVVESIRKGKIPFEDENCNVYFCSNVCKYPYYSVDFGWGKPERVGTPNGPCENFFFLKDYQTGRGVEARVMLQKQHMSEFEGDEELLEFISSSVPST